MSEPKQLIMSGRAVITLRVGPVFVGSNFRNIFLGSAWWKTGEIPQQCLRGGGGFWGMQGCAACGGSGESKERACLSEKE